MKRAKSARSVWSVQWRSENCLSGTQRHLLFDGGMPLLFRRRSEARAYILDKYGYIAKRPDLRMEPHGWRMPRPVRVRVEVIND